MINKINKFWIVSTYSVAIYLESQYLWAQTNLKISFYAKILIRGT